MQSHPTKSHPAVYFSLHSSPPRITVANLILEYILANAAAIRGFAPYFSMLVNKPADFFITPYTAPYGTSYNLDWCVVSNRE